jgi:hypothetical protein
MVLYSFKTSLTGTANSGTVEELCALAKHTNTPLDTLKELSAHESEEVRDCAAANSTLKAWVLEQKVSFNLTHWDDNQTEDRLPFLSKLETMFDHPRNMLPDDYYLLTENIPLGSTIKITIEFVNSLD